jgi:hypothetical protein
MGCVANFFSHSRNRLLPILSNDDFFCQYPLSVCLSQRAHRIKIVQAGADKATFFHGENNLKQIR